MWVMTRSDWPVLINLSRAASITYQQIVKFDPRTRIVASAWEQEHVVADCENGEEAKAVMELIARSLADGAELLDLRRVDLAGLGPGHSIAGSAHGVGTGHEDRKPGAAAPRS